MKLSIFIACIVVTSFWKYKGAEGHFYKPFQIDVSAKSPLPLYTGQIGTKVTPSSDGMCQVPCSMLTRPTYVDQVPQKSPPFQLLPLAQHVESLEKLISNAFSNKPTLMNIFTQSELSSLLNPVNKQQIPDELVEKCLVFLTTLSAIQYTTPSSTFSTPPPVSSPKPAPAVNENGKLISTAINLTTSFQVASPDSPPQTVVPPSKSPDVVAVGNVGTTQKPCSPGSKIICIPVPTIPAKPLLPKPRPTHTLKLPNLFVPFLANPPKLNFGISLLPCPPAVPKLPHSISSTVPCRPRAPELPSSPAPTASSLPTTPKLPPPATQTVPCPPTTPKYIPPVPPTVPCPPTTPKYIPPVPPTVPCPPTTPKNTPSVPSTTPCIPNVSSEISSTPCPLPIKKNKNQAILDFVKSIKFDCSQPEAPYFLRLIFCGLLSNGKRVSDVKPTNLYEQSYVQSEKAPSVVSIVRIPKQNSTASTGVSTIPCTLSISC